MKVPPIVGLLTIVLIAGCARSGEKTSAVAPSAYAGTAIAVEAVIGRDVAHGKLIFSANCAQCHGIAGTGTKGGVFPVLVGERKKKNLAATLAWIENPQPPMPKYYPGTLSAKDVAAVAAYVQTL